MVPVIFFDSRKLEDNPIIPLRTFTSSSLSSSQLMNKDNTLLILFQKTFASCFIYNANFQKITKLDNKLSRNRFAKRGKAQNATFYREPTIQFYSEQRKKILLIILEETQPQVWNLYPNYTCNEDNILLIQLICCCICLLFV